MAEHETVVKNVSELANPKPIVKAPRYLRVFTPPDVLYQELVDSVKKYIRQTICG